MCLRSVFSETVIKICINTVAVLAKIKQCKNLLQGTHVECLQHSYLHLFTHFYFKAAHEQNACCSFHIPVSYKSSSAVTFKPILLLIRAELWFVTLRASVTQTRNKPQALRMK